jgi:hypothetical protein
VVLGVVVDKSEAVDAIDEMRIFRFRVTMPNCACNIFTSNSICVKKQSFDTVSDTSFRMIA